MDAVTRGGEQLLGHMPMQRVQPDDTTPLPLRQSSHSMGTLMIRFVGLLTLTVIAMTLLWSL